MQLDTLGKFTTSPASKLLVPLEPAGLPGAAQALRAVLDDVLSADGMTAAAR